MIGSKVRNFSNVVVVSAKRTPVGGFMGSLSQEHPSALGTHAIKAALEQASLDPA
jgi:acetyl-CoA C-acetyltransferase